MGTSWSVRFAAPPAIDIEAVRSGIEARLDTIIAEMSHWRADSLISAYNRAASGSWTTLPDDFDAVVTAALDIASRSGGAFDPTIGHVVDLRGFGPDPALRNDDEPVIAEILDKAGWHRLRHEDGRLLQPGWLALDLSGIAKGYAVDAVADCLADQSIAHALVEIGGELAGRGVRPDGDPWWVDLEDPPGAALPPLRIALHGLAVATSGDYRRGAHTIDPRSGRSASAGLRSVSVIHASAMHADAWATALTVLGVGEGLALAAREGLAVRFVDDREHISPALAEMLEY
ncbi:thiamine biosynthesis protein ApbE [Sphingomonas sp. Root710]|nr:thiamine biosynthesis protein ApbE [Sphingomonas sp. Root710]